MFLLFVNTIFLLASEVTIVRCRFLFAIVKFPSFMFKNNSKMAFNSPRVAFSFSDSLHVEACQKAGVLSI